MLIDEIFDVTAGQVMSRITDEVNYVEERRLLLPKAISNGFVLEQELVNNKMKAKLEESKMTMLNDIVIKLSTPYGGCIINDKNVGLVVPSFCAILRKKNNKYNDDYLIAYINSSSFAEQVQKMVTGSVIGILSIGSLKKIDIPCFDLKLQNEIGKEFRKKATNAELLKKLLFLQEEKIEALIAEGEKVYE